MVGKQCTSETCQFVQKEKIICIGAVQSDSQGEGKYM